MSDMKQDTAPHSIPDQNTAANHPENRIEKDDSQTDDSKLKDGQSDQNTQGSANQNTDFQFDHVAQQVPDIAEAVAWYLTLFPQAKVLYQDTSWAFVDVAGTKLAFVKEDQHPSHLAWRVSNAQLEQLAARYNQRIALHRDKTRSFYLEAPGKQWIEIISTEEATWAQSAPKNSKQDEADNKPTDKTDHK